MKIAKKSFENVTEFIKALPEKDSGKSKLHSQRNYEHIKFEECLLQISSESFFSPPK
jgi:hypothetical protein